MTTNGNCTTALTELLNVRTELEALYADYNGRALAGEGDPLDVYGNGRLAHGLDMALRKVEAAVVRLERQAAAHPLTLDDLRQMDPAELLGEVRG